MRNIANINRLLVITAVLTPLVIAPGTDDHFYWPKIFAVFCAVLGMMVVHTLSPDRKKVTFDLPIILLACYLTLVLISTIFSIDIVNSIWGHHRREEGLFALVAYALLFVFARTYYRFEKWHLKALVGSCLMVAIYGIVQYYGFDPIPRDFMRATWRTAFSTLGNQNFLSSYLVLLIPLWAILFLKSGAKLYLLTLGTLYFTLLLTMTRGGWLGLIPIIVLLIYYAFLNPGVRTRLIVILAILIAISMAFDASEGGKLARRAGTIADEVGKVATSGEGPNGLSWGRPYIWSRTWNLVLDRPLIGYGPETLHIPFVERYQDEMLENFKVVFAVDKAHNEYLHIAVSSGIPAALLFIAFATSVILRAWKFRQHVGIFAVATAVTGYMAQAVSNISVVSVAYLFWIMLGVLDGQVLSLGEGGEVGGSTTP